MTELIGVLAVAALFALFGLCRRERAGGDQACRGTCTGSCAACGASRTSSESSHVHS